MSIDSLVDKMDNAMLSLANKTVNKFNEYFGGTKYDLARLCEYITLGSAVLGFSHSMFGDPCTTLMGGAMTWVACDHIKYSYELEQIESGYDGALPPELKVESDFYATHRFPLLGIGITNLILLPLGKTSGSSFPAMTTALLLLQSASLYFKSCDYTPRQRGRLFEKVQTPQSVTAPID